MNDERIDIRIARESGVPLSLVREVLSVEEDVRRTQSSATPRESAIAAPRETAGEPVAWMFKLRGPEGRLGNPFIVLTKREADDYPNIYERTPLYAAPVRPVEGPSFELPMEMLRMYDLAADKAVSVGALKMMHKAEAAIGRWYMKQRHAALSSEALDA